MSADRRAGQRERLVACAEAAIAAHGLAGLKARHLAQGVGCSVGAIYNLVQDLDELTLLVAQRTLAALNAGLDAVAAGAGDEDRFTGWALAYCAFAAEHRNLWRALFEFRLPPGRDLPDWFETDRARLFERLEDGLRQRLPGLNDATLRLRARTLFSAVHGIVALGLEGKIADTSLAALEAELVAFVRAYLSGLILLREAGEGDHPKGGGGGGPLAHRRKAHAGLA